MLELRKQSKNKQTNTKNCHFSPIFLEVLDENIHLFFVILGIFGL